VGRTKDPLPPTTRKLAAGPCRGPTSGGCEWLHVDFDDDLRAFYFDACGFTPTNAGLKHL
jgi:hypothetical protein